MATATNGSDGLRLFMSQPVHAVVLEYHLGLLDGATIADQIKRVQPDVPIVMLVDHVELPADALKSVDALVVKSDGPHFLLATVHFVLNVKSVQRHEADLRSQTPAHLRRLGRARAGVEPRTIQGGPARTGGANSGKPNLPQPAANPKEAPFSGEVWQRIRNGTLQF